VLKGAVNYWPGWNDFVCNPAVLQRSTFGVCNRLEEQYQIWVYK
jgi:hypothetical protein